MPAEFQRIGQKYHHFAQATGQHLSDVLRSVGVKPESATVLAVKCMGRISEMPNHELLQIFKDHLTLRADDQKVLHEFAAENALTQREPKVIKPGDILHLRDGDACETLICAAKFERKDIPTILQFYTDSFNKFRKTPPIGLNSLYLEMKAPSGATLRFAYEVDAPLEYFKLYYNNSLIKEVKKFI